MTKNSRRRDTKKTAAKDAVKAGQRKLQKRAQTEISTAILDKDLGLVYSVGAFQQPHKSVTHHKFYKGQTDTTGATDTEQPPPSG